MASIQPLPQAENISAIPHQKHHQQQHLHPTMSGPSPRKALSQLSANAVISPLKQKPYKSNAPTTLPYEHHNPLKRSAVSILDSDKGFQYLKRRKQSPVASPRNVSIPVFLPSPNALYPSVDHRDIAPPPPTIHKTPATRPTSRHRRPAPNPASSDDDRDDPSHRDPDSDSHDSSQHSFGSLINYDPSSQNRNATPRFGSQAWYAHQHHQQQQLLSSTHRPSAAQHRPRHSSRAVNGGPERDGIGSRAELLQTKLRLAVYKVLTGQTHTPFSRLRVYRSIIPRVVERRAGAAQGRRLGHRSRASEMFGPPLEAVGKARQSSTGDETIVVESDGEEEDLTITDMRARARL